MAGFTPQPLAAFVGDASASVRMSVPSGVSSLAFDEARSVIWVGLEDGRVVAFEFPTARVYSSVQLHRGRVRKLLAFPGGLGGGIVSLSSSRLCLHTVKGMLINEWSAKANHGGQTDIFKSLRCCTLFAMGDQPCIALSGGSGGKRGDDASSTTAKQRSDGGFGRVVLFVRAQPMLDRAGNPWKKGSEPFARIKLPYDVTSLASATPVRQSFNAVAENIVVGTSTGDVYTVELRLLGQRAGGQIQAMLVGTPRRHFQLSRPVSCLAVQGRMLASASGTLPGSIQPPVHLRDLVTQRQHDAGAPPMHGRRYQIAFIPTTSDTSPVEMVVATNSGSWSICAPGAGAPAQVHRLAFAAHAGPSCRLVALAAAPSGQMIAFGDSAGVVHLFKSGGLAAELPSVHAGFVAVPLGAHPAKVPAPASFSAPPVPRSSADPTTGAPTTTWELPPALGGRLAIFPPPRSQFFDLCSELPPYEVDQVMMRHARRTVATKLKEAAQSEGSGDFLSFIANEKSAGFGFVPPNSMLFGERKDEAYDVVDPRLTEAEEGDYASAAPRKWTPVPGVPVEYTRPEIVLGKYGHFDYSAYNSTPWAALQNLEPDCSVVNVEVQMLHALPGLRAAMLRLQAAPISVLACELGCLFHMLIEGSSHNPIATGNERDGDQRLIAPTNFVRALRRTKDATRMGITVPSTKPLRERFQILHTFLLQQLEREEADQHLALKTRGGSTVVKSLFGSSQRVTNDFVQSGTSSVSHRQPLVIEVEQPEGTPSSRSAESLLAELERALCGMKRSRAWSEVSKGYEAITRTSVMEQLPRVLSLSLRAVGERERHDAVGVATPTAGAGPGAAVAAPTPPPRGLPMIVAIALGSSAKKGKPATPARVFHRTSVKVKAPGEPEHASVYVLTAVVSLVRYERQTTAPPPRAAESAIAQLGGSSAAEFAASSGLTPPSASDEPIVSYREQLVLHRRNTNSERPPRREAQREQAAASARGDTEGGASSSPAKSKSKRAGRKRSHVLSQEWTLFNDFSVQAVSESDVATLGLGLDAESGVEAMQQWRFPLVMQYEKFPLQHRTAGKIETVQEQARHVAESDMQALLKARLVEETGRGKVPARYAAQMSYLRAHAPVSPFKVAVFGQQSLAQPAGGGGGGNGRGRSSLSQQLFSPFRPAAPTFVSLPIAELPSKGSVVAIDCEFVEIEPEEAHVRADGRRMVKRPARLTLGRMSVIDGTRGGKKKLKSWDSASSNLGGVGERSSVGGVCFIDDYIHTEEAVTDYLTRFSGLVREDLDPQLSRRHLVPLRTAYLKLRLLVDRGCTIVGHGLEKDFAIVNIFVPKANVRDTVDLFRLPNRRMISLRFLAAYLLGLDMQTADHDSVTDARTALLCYREYERLVASGEFAATLQDMYSKGQQTGWKMVNGIRLS